LPQVLAGEKKAVLHYAMLCQDSTYTDLAVIVA